MKDDSELVRLAVGGDRAAFAELYERYFDAVFDFLARMVRNRDEAADLAQETFVRAMNGLSSLTKGGSFKSWLFTIARNTALNRLERSSRFQPMGRQFGDDDAAEMQVVDESRFANPEEAAEASAYAALVWEAAASLDPRSYAVLDLSVRQNLTSEELAEVLGVKRNNAYVMVNRMKAALESAIGSLMLLRKGRQQCAELDAALRRLQVAELTPAARKAIDDHARRCAACSEHRRRLASPFAILAGLGLVYPAAEVKEQVLADVAEEYDNTYGSALDTSTFLGGISVAGDAEGELTLIESPFGASPSISDSEWSRTDREDLPELT